MVVSRQLGSLGQTWSLWIGFFSKNIGHKIVWDLGMAPLFSELNVIGIN